MPTKVVDFPNGHDLVEVPDTVLDSNRFHVGGYKRLSDLINDFSLTMQHALRVDLPWLLKERAIAEAGVLPPLSPVEMFDYLADSDDEFFNWCFPFCAVKLTDQNLGPIHLQILSAFRAELAASNGETVDTLRNATKSE